MDLYNIMENIKRVMEAPDEYCKRRMDQVPLPIDDHKYDPIRKYMDTPVPEGSNHWKPDCDNLVWVPATKEASDWYYEAAGHLALRNMKLKHGRLANIRGTEKWRVLYMQLLDAINENPKSRKWYNQYDGGEIIEIVKHVAQAVAETYVEALEKKEVTGGEVIEAPNYRDYWVAEEELLAQMLEDLMFVIPSPEDVARQHGRTIKKETKNEDMNEAAIVFSDANGHHLKNADGEIVQSFEKTPEGLRAARNALYADYNVLSMEKPKESTMNEYEEKYNTALNESLTINTTAGTDQSDTVNVTATDEDAHTLVAILKAAGLPYKEQEARLMATTPCGADVGEQVEEEYANTPNDANDYSSTDTLLKIQGGLNREKKQFRREYPGDNPMAVNEENLMRGLWDLYKKV